MSEKLPYEEQLDQAWEALPLPDEDMAWKDMKRRLDEDDDDPIVVPPPRRGCGIGAVLIALVLLGILWFLIRPEKWFTKNENETAQQTNSNTNKQNDDTANKNEVQIKPGAEKGSENKTDVSKEGDTKSFVDSASSPNTSIQNTNTIKQEAETRPEIEIKDAGVKKTEKRSEPLTTSDDVSIQTKSAGTKKKKPAAIEKEDRSGNNPITKTSDEKKPKTPAIKKNDVVRETESKKPEQEVVSKPPVDKAEKDVIQIKPDSSKVDTVISANKTATQPVSTENKDSSLVRETESKKPEQEIVSKPSVDSAEKDVIQIKPDSSKVDTVISTNKTETQPESTEKKDSSLVRDTSTARKKENIYFFSAGLGLHQQLPIAGQKLTPYNSLGRKGSLADYIPSLYFRYHNKYKWFVQAEFRYGAPQYTKEITYKADTVLDPGPNPVGSSISSYTVKKTYYHQFPVTFNYMIIPNWSMGAGIQLNSLYGLVAEHTTGRRIIVTQTDTLFTKTIVQVDKDTVDEFKKSYLLGVAETQYQWKRFSIGAKYSFGLQPYIQFQLSGGPPQKEKSQAIQVFLRYQLWKSREKSKEK